MNPRGRLAPSPTCRRCPPDGRGARPGRGFGCGQRASCGPAPEVVRPRASVAAASVVAACVVASSLGCGAAVAGAARAADAGPASEAGGVGTGGVGNGGGEAPPAAVVLPVSLAMRDGRSVDGARLSHDRVVAALAAARVVYVGELHSVAAHHGLQAAIVGALVAAIGGERPVGVGLEMVARPLQPVLDAWVAGSLDEETLLRRLDWERRWGFDFALYRPVFALARERGLPMFALNARPEVVRKVGRGEPLDAAERAELPEIDRENAAHTAMVRAMLAGHPGLTEAALDRYVEAQRVWDETMAEHVARALAAPDAPRVLVVLAGVAHVRGGHGIPSRAARRGVGPQLVVLPADADPAPGDADFVYDVERAP